MVPKTGLKTNGRTFWYGYWYENYTHTKRRVEVTCGVVTSMTIFCISSVECRIYIYICMWIRICLNYLWPERNFNKNISLECDVEIRVASFLVEHLRKNKIKQNLKRQVNRFV